MTTLWDTTGTAIVHELAKQRHTGGAVVSGVALTLVVVVDESRVAEAEEAAAVAAAQHPCRILVVLRRQIDAPTPRLDAEVLIGGRLGPGEAVVMRMYGRLGLHAESVVVPLLAADVPVVTWWHTPPPQQLATDALAVIADRRITDCALAADPLAALRTRADDYTPGDTDLAWTRSTPWRSVLTSTLDAAAARRGAPLQLRGGRILGDPTNATTALLAGWLTWRCGCDIEIVDTGRVTAASGVTGVILQLGHDEEVQVRSDNRGRAVLTESGRPAATLTLPERSPGDLLGEELRRLDPDEPYSKALEVATGRTGLAGRSYLWMDPAPRPGATNGLPDGGNPTDSRDSGGTVTHRPATGGAVGTAEQAATERAGSRRDEKPARR